MNETEINDVKHEIDISQIELTLESHNYKLKTRLRSQNVYLVYSEKYREEFVAKVSVNPVKRKTAEITALITLIHPNIIQMYEYFFDDDFVYIILEYCPYKSLEEIVDSYGCFRDEQLYEICRQILSAIEHCHSQKIAHCNINPRNILIDKNGRVKLIDFAKSSHNGIIETKNIHSMIEYIAPEVLNFGPQIDAYKADIWALGVTFYFLATGELPWGSPDNLTNMIHLPNITIPSEIQEKLQLINNNAAFDNEILLSISKGYILPNEKIKKDFYAVIKSMMRVSPMKRESAQNLLLNPVFLIEQPVARKFKGVQHSLTYMGDKRPISKILYSGNRKSHEPFSLTFRSDRKSSNALKSYRNLRALYAKSQMPTAFNEP